MRACAQVRERVRVCACPGVRVCAVYYLRVRVNKTSDSVRVVVAIAWGIDTRAACATIRSPVTSRNQNQNGALAHENYTFEHRSKREND